MQRQQSASCPNSPCLLQATTLGNFGLPSSANSSTDAYALLLERSQAWAGKIDSSGGRLSTADLLDPKSESVVEVFKYSLRSNARGENRQ